MNNNTNYSESMQIVIIISSRLIKISYLKSSLVGLKALLIPIFSPLKLRKKILLKINLQILNFNSKLKKKKIINDCLISNINNIRSLNVILYLLFSQ